MESESEVTSAVEVIHIVRQLIRNRELMNVAFGQGRSMTTLLLDADPNRGTLVFDGSSDEALNRDIVSTAKVIFSGSLHGAKIRFSSAGVKQIAYQGAPALQIKFPHSLSRFQSRETFRVRTSLSCHLPVRGRGSVKVPASEISIGGVQLTLNHSLDAFTIGQKILNCEFDLGDTRLRCDLEVRSIKRMPSRALGMGCRFVGLSKADEAAIARFVAQEERKSIAKKSLFDL